ncbi:kinase-like protein, partial [Hortaea werneckii]
MAAVAHHSRPHIRRTSPVAALHSNNGFSADAPALQRFGMDDSDSDDEPPPAIKFSKVTQALLDDAPMPSSPPKQEHVSEAPRFNRSVSSSKAGLDTPSRGSGIKVIRKSSPSLAGEGRNGTPPRVVQVGKNSGSAQRSVSIAGSYPHRFATRRDPTPEPNGRPEIVTPAPRALRVSRTRANSNASQDEQQHVPSSLSRSASRQGSRYGLDSGDRNRHVSDLSHGASLQQPQETATRFGSSTIGRSRNVSAENAPPGSQRIKRAPIGTGSFLKSGPVRRGFRRRDSEDNVSPAEDASAPGSQPSASNYTPRDTSASRVDGGRSRNGSVSTRATSVEPGSHHDFAYKSHASHESRNANSHLSHSQIGSASRPGSRQAQHNQARSRQASVEPEPVRRRPSVPAVDGVSGTHQHQESRQSAMDYKSYRSDDEQRPAQRRPSLNRANYRVMPSKGHTNGSEDQENMPPPTFRRNKDQDFKYFGKQSVSVMSDDEKPKHRIPQETPVPVPNQQQERKALGTISGNTPHRPAPAPPPKMSVLDAATTTAGASVTKSKKKRSHIVINGKIFTQMGKLGKGGSSDVYCVMAENYKTFALKRVKLDDCDEAAVVGYKGEIDLLRKLTEVERVVRLFDWELNEDKQELLVLMEKGDTDLNRLLTLRLNGIDAKFDSISARYNWKEMLECVQAVHDHDIVHSDLKPANFLIVQGRLKLIDFGIANAIDTD